MKRLSGYDVMTIEETVHPLWRQLLRLGPKTTTYVGSAFSWETAEGKRAWKRKTMKLYWFWIGERNSARRALNFQRGRV